MENIRSLLLNLGHVLIDLVGKVILCLPDDDLFRHFHFTVFIHMDIAHVVQRFPIFFMVVFVGSLQLFHNGLDGCRSPEHIADVEQVIAHKAGPNHFLAFQLAGDGENGCSIQLNHFTLIVFTQNREEV